MSAIFDNCGFVFPADLVADRVERYLESLRTGAGRLSVQTTNDYLQAVSQFCHWMVENDRLDRNPFAKVKKLNPERDRRHVRRVPDAAELRRIGVAAHAGPTRKRLTGPDRAMLYRVAASTGYRAGELAALTPECFALDGSPPSIDLDGRFTKNGKPACQPIPRELAADLRGFLSGREAGRPVWPGSWADRAAALIQADAGAAGVPVTVDTKDGSQVLDFHSLRGATATFLDALDICLKARLQLMRHSDPRLTLNRNTRAKLHDLGAAVDKFPDLRPAGPMAEPAILRATGTAGGCSSDAVAGGNQRLRLRTPEETNGPAGILGLCGSDNAKPLEIQGLEKDRGVPEDY